ncbi:hypothetical protein RFI_29614, partial [Reticulomyxa filosa]
SLHLKFIINPFQTKVFRVGKNNLLSISKKRRMLLIDAETGEEESKENKRSIFSFSDCYKNNGKCPIQQHDYCEFLQVKTARKLVSELLNCNCNFKGKIKDLKDHLDKTCNLIPVKQSIPYEITDQLNVMNKQIKELQDVVKDLQSQSQTEKLQTVLSYFFVFFKIIEKDQQIFELTKDIQKFKTEMNQTIIDLKKQQNQQIDNLKHELQEKDQTINALKIDSIEFKKQLEQYQIKFDQYIETR